MTLNYLGLTAALTAFLSIWIGHVAVRKIEFISPTIWFPTIIFIALGIGVEYLSLTTHNYTLSAVEGTQYATIFGILGITLLFDAYELTRQQKRIRKGHAPANPNNPRHALILKEYSSATTIDLLKREPTDN